MMKTLKDFKNIIDRISDNGLDLTRYTIVEVIPQNNGIDAIIEHSNEIEHPHWCLRYCGNGHYFTTSAELMDYYRKRCFKKSDVAERACMEFIEENKLGLIEGMKARDKNGWHVGWSKAMTMVEVPKWISVEERLPEEGIRKVLVCVKHEHGNITDTARYMGQHGWDLSTWKVHNDCVTHWMPMPEPPEEDECE